ncbi:MAG: alpha/beta hydrolase [Lactobacillus sp.]|nr:alpha/beta hydrolase [Lactobacillus sp.]
MSYYQTEDGIKLNFHFYGKGKPIVLITGFGGYQEIWLKQISYLVDMGYQVLTYDHRNMGQSERTANGHTLRQLTADLINLLGFLGINHAGFIGHSMGGSILFALIDTKPDLVDLACIVDQSPYMLNTTNWHFGFMNFTSQNYKIQCQKIPNINETFQGLNSDVAHRLNLIKAKFPFVRQNNLDLLQEHIRYDWRDLVKYTNCKIAVFASRQSPYYNAEFANWMCQNNLHIKCAILDNCGHDIMAEKPRQFNQLLRHFLLSSGYLP